MNILVIGCGSIGQRHLRNLRGLGISPLSAVDPDPGCADAARAAGAVVHGDLEGALAARPEVALVCTPPHLHLDAARAALAAEAHVFVEKPLAASLEGVDDVLALAAARGRLLAVGYNLRFHPAVQEVKRLLDGGAIGRPLMLRLEFGQYLPDWRPRRDYRAGYNARAAMGGGILLDASHEFDCARWLCGEIKGVTAMAGKLSDLDIDVEDAALVHLRFAGGVLGEVHLDSLQRAYTRGGKLVGTEGTLTWDFAEGVRVYRAAHGAWDARPTVVDPNHMYVEEIRHFLTCVRTGADPAVSGQDGRRALEIALAARVSARERREVAL
jgi:predicted dehydrogenase